MEMKIIYSLLIVTVRHNHILRILFHRSLFPFHYFILILECIYDKENVIKFPSNRLLHCIVIICCHVICIFIFQQ